MDVSRVFEHRMELYNKLKSTRQGLFVIATLDRYDSISNLPKRAYGDVRIKPDEIDIEAMTICKKYMDNVNNEVRQGRGLFITGTPGNGKTTWMYKIARRYMENMSRSNSDTVRPVYYANVPTLLSEIKQGFTDKDLERSIEKRMKESDVVIFDDIGAENSTDWVKEKLYEYINYRYSNNLTSLYTSNLKLNQLERRVADRINGSCTVVEFQSQSKRQQLK